VAQEAETNRLVVIIASIEQTNQLSQELVQHNFDFTRVDNASGLIAEAVVCLLVGIPHIRMGLLTRLIKECCEPRLKFIPARLSNQAMQLPPVMIEAQVGGATIYTFEVEHSERF
jgi:uncharacterized protein YaaQ